MEDSVDKCHVNKYMLQKDHNSNEEEKLITGKRVKNNTDPDPLMKYLCLFPNLLLLALLSLKNPILLNEKAEIPNNEDQSISFIPIS